LSVLTRVAQWVSAAAKTPAGRAAAASTIGADIAAVQAAIELINDLAAGRATIAEALSAGLSLDKALAPLLPAPIVEDLQLAIGLAEGLTALYQALPPSWRAQNLPNLPLGKDGKNPYSGAPVFT
jgi:hypothetical protein